MIECSSSVMVMGKEASQPQAQGWQVGGHIATAFIVGFPSLANGLSPKGL